MEQTRSKNEVKGLQGVGRCRQERDRAPAKEDGVQKILQKCSKLSQHLTVPISATLVAVPLCGSVEAPLVS